MSAEKKDNEIRNLFGLSNNPVPQGVSSLEYYAKRSTAEPVDPIPLGHGAYIPGPPTDQMLCQPPQKRTRLTKEETLITRANQRQEGKERPDPIVKVKLRIIKFDELPEVDRSRQVDFMMSKHLEMQDKAYGEHLRKLYQFKLAQITAEEARNVYGDDQMAHLIEYKEKVQAEKEKSDGTRFIYITVNPDPSQPDYVTKTLKQVNKLLSNQNNHSHAWSIENFTANGERTHFHILIMRQKCQQHEPKRFKTMCERLFGDLCDLTPNTLKVIFGKGDENFEKVYAYIRGEKSPEKMDNVLKDREWRQQQGFEQYYESPGFPAEEVYDQLPEEL